MMNKHQSIFSLQCRSAYRLQYTRVASWKFPFQLSLFNYLKEHFLKSCILVLYVLNFMINFGKKNTFLKFSEVNWNQSVYSGEKG